MSYRYCMPLILFIFILSFMFTTTACSEEKQAPKADSVSIAAKSTNAIPCVDIVTEIVSTCPRYVKLTDGLTDRIIKNGGTSYGITLEGSPDKTDETVSASETYDFNLHETYPDHSPVITRFSFDPKTQKLYEYDAVSDSLISITFDYTLLDKLKQGCK